MDMTALLGTHPASTSGQAEAVREQQASSGRHVLGKMLGKNMPGQDAQTRSDAYTVDLAPSDNNCCMHVRAACAGTTHVFMDFRAQ